MNFILQYLIGLVTIILYSMLNHDITTCIIPAVVYELRFPIYLAIVWKLEVLWTHDLSWNTKQVNNTKTSDFKVVGFSHIHHDVCLHNVTIFHHRGRSCIQWGPSVHQTLLPVVNCVLANQVRVESRARRV